MRKKNLCGRYLSNDFFIMWGNGNLMVLPSEIKVFNLYFFMNMFNYLVSTRGLKAGIYLADEIFVMRGW